MKRFAWSMVVFAGACAAPPSIATKPAQPTSVEAVVEHSDEPDASAPPAAPPRERGPTRQQRWAELSAEVAAQPGWSLHEAAHYFIVSAVDDAAFLDELKERCESIRRVIAEDFPHPDADPVPVLSAPNVLRVCKKDEQYFAYGGGSGSSGYWSVDHHEIVIYDDREGGGRRGTWATLNSMVFMEYASVLSDGYRVAPWFLYGHSDYYGGFDRTKDGYSARAFDWRERYVQVNIQTEKVLPLDRFVRLRQDAFYATGGDAYAQGWSLIWFLRQGAERSKSWNPAWSGILDAWWSIWLATHDNDVATERAFAGVDWPTLEGAWKNFTLRGE